MDESFKGPLKGKILVVGVFEDPIAHKIFEDSFADGLVKSGADAVLVVHLNNEKKQIENFAPHGLMMGGVLYGDDLDGYHTFVVEKTLVPENTLTRTVNLNHLLRVDDEGLEKLYIKDMKRHHLL